MKKIIFASPFILLATLVLIISWANLATEEGGIPEDYSKEDQEAFKGKEYIDSAWKYWSRDSNRGFQDADYKNNVTFISLRSIKNGQQEALGLRSEITEMKKIIGLLDGNPAALSDSERAAYQDVFNQKLEAAYNSIN